jgi:hypothetical protein
VFDPIQDLLEVGRASEIDVKVAIGEALEVDVRIGESRERAAAEPDHLGAATGGPPRARTDGEDATVRTYSDLRSAPAEKRCPHSP